MADGIALDTLEPPLRGRTIQELVERYVASRDPSARITLFDTWDAGGGEVGAHARGLFDGGEWMMSGWARACDGGLELHLAAWCPGPGMSEPERLDPVNPPLRAATLEEVLAAYCYHGASLKIVGQSDRAAGTLYTVEGELGGPNVDRDEREWTVRVMVRKVGGEFELVAGRWN